MKREDVIPVVVAGRRRLHRDLAAFALETSRRPIRVVAAVDTVDDALGEPAEVMVLTLADGSGVAVVRAGDLQTWTGEQPQPAAATILGWDSEPTDLALLVTRVATDTMPTPAVDSGAVSMLTSRETEILGLLGAGWDPSTIARELGISEHTVRTHLTRINDKLGVQSRLAAAAVARRQGIIALRAQSS